MMNKHPDAARQLERLAAWHRIQADHAEAAWIWEARLFAAEALEQRGAELRRSLTGEGSGSRADARYRRGAPGLSRSDAGALTPSDHPLVCDTWTIADSQELFPFRSHD